VFFPFFHPKKSPFYGENDDQFWDFPLKFPVSGSKSAGRGRRELIGSRITVVFSMVFLAAKVRLEPTKKPTGYWLKTIGKP